MLNFLIDYLFPKNDKIVEIEELTSYKLAEQALPAPHLSMSEETNFIHPIFSYRDKMIKNCLWDLKYHANIKVAETFAPLILDKIIEILSEEALFNEKEKPIIISIPPSKTRKQTKGFDQEKIILEAIEKSDSNKSFEIKYDVLDRARDTKQQSLLHNKYDRQENMKNVFKVKNQEEIKGRVVIIVDDIVTTGATLLDTKRALLDSRARKVYAITIAH